MSDFPVAAKDDPEADGNLRKVTVMNPPEDREIRPVTNLGKVFGKFAELQQQIAEQVVALEDSVHHQREDVASAVSQLPELREHINWLIAGLQEQNKKDEAVRERLNQHDQTLATLLEATHTLQETQARWQAAIEQIVDILIKARL